RGADYTALSDYAELVPQVVEPLRWKRPAQVVSLQLRPEFLFLHAGLDHFGDPLTQRDEVLAELPDIVLGQNGPVPRDGHVEIELPHAVEPREPIDETLAR